MYLVFIEGKEYRIEAPNRSKARREAAHMHKEQTHSHWAIDVLYIMATTRKLPSGVKDAL